MIALGSDRHGAQVLDVAAQVTASIGVIPSTLISASH